jgi:hypothetical protein
MKKIVFIFALIFSLSIIPAFADPGDPGGGPGGGDPPVGDPPVGAPIDGGAVALLVAGAVYGAKRMKKGKN